MNEQIHAQALVERLSDLERDALRGLLGGESVRDLARQLAIGVVKAADIRDAMTSKLGATQDADAVRIGLIAGTLEASD